MSVAMRPCGCRVWYEPWGDVLRSELPGQLREFDDDGLKRLRRTASRAIEDGKADANTTALIATIRQVQLGRLRLRMRYGATFHGTFTYDCYQRHNTAPSYELAMLMDRFRWQSGERHVLDWPRIEAMREARSRPKKNTCAKKSPAGATP